MIRTIVLYEDHFLKFHKDQELTVQEKIEYVLDMVRFENHVPKRFFKRLENTDGIYEVRVITSFKSIRILCFLDDGNLVVLMNCFLKKTQKTPKKEINLAEKLKKEYLNNKNV
ncbi:type II toxin-antitoxin system RelE/ParE family toxin [Moheibacter lacus]|uniref:Type II toxin-antitoxin system RelE/ParE family toxin n=1 Tax=Moheibacter lacus TaxID=2745851 RepID=A0A838ZS65_9FLAO|nr:type II toxin-antitoxin system RelE/ParE family toxin [Moheibacter lacus]MBA5628989.1 type II toxin-antitoxin system RelE/ParE family toxin [Moheibacter lacus]